MGFEFLPKTAKTFILSCSMQHAYFHIIGKYSFGRLKEWIPHTQVTKPHFYVSSHRCLFFFLLFWNIENILLSTGIVLNQQHRAQAFYSRFLISGVLTNQNIVFTFYMQNRFSVFSSDWSRKMRRHIHYYRVEKENHFLQNYTEINE